MTGEVIELGAGVRLHHRIHRQRDFACASLGYWFGAERGRCAVTGGRLARRGLRRRRPRALVTGGAARIAAGGLDGEFGDAAALPERHCST